MTRGEGKKLHCLVGAGATCYIAHFAGLWHVKRMKGQRLKRRNKHDDRNGVDMGMKLGLGVCKRMTRVK